jgi:hypothetical protein
LKEEIKNERESAHFFLFAAKKSKTIQKSLAKKFFM